MLHDEVKKYMKEMASKGGRKSWEGVSKEDRSRIMSERVSMRWAKKNEEK